VQTSFSGVKLLDGLSFEHKRQITSESALALYGIPEKVR
jgi:hypothetical protein